MCLTMRGPLSIVIILRLIDMSEPSLTSIRIAKKTIYIMHIREEIKALLKQRRMLLKEIKALREKDAI